MTTSTTPIEVTPNRVWILEEKRLDGTWGNLLAGYLWITQEMADSEYKRITGRTGVEKNRYRVTCYYRPDFGVTE